MQRCLTQKLKRLRKKNNMSQEQLAHIIGVTIRTIQRWENKSCKPSKLAQEKIKSVLKKL